MGTEGSVSGSIELSRGGKSADRYRRIYSVVARIPRGRVATYGQVARLAGLAGHARLVGYALSALEDGSRIPWHRVVNAKGRISLRGDRSPANVVQRLRLERESIRFDGSGVISLERFRWRPR
jgi:methylated-DNA-protein-cysteine methyltransferase related protein